MSQGQSPTEQMGLLAISMTQAVMDNFKADQAKEVEERRKLQMQALQTQELEKKSTQPKQET